MQPFHLLFAWLKIIEYCTDQCQDRLLRLVVALIHEVFCQDTPKSQCSNELF